MKKKIAVWTAACLLLCGCGRIMDRYEAGNARYRMAASCYPIYCLALMAVRDAPDLTLTCLTQPQDGCLRDYRLSEWDAATAAGCDALVLGGRGLESYESVFRAWQDGPILICALYGLELENDGAAGGGDETSHFDTENPWLFLSPDGAMKIVTSIAGSMQEIDPDCAGIYAENRARAMEALESLAVDMLAETMGVPARKAAVMHEGLSYFADFMGLDTVYTFRRESGSAVSDTMLEGLLEDLEAAGAEVALVEKQAPQAFTEALEAAGFRVCRVDTLSAHAADGDADAYCGIMRENARALADACR